jgi:hypothetical protein
MSRWKECVLDASMDVIGGMFTFCPIEGDVESGDFDVITGMNYGGERSPNGMKLVAIIHPDGQKAAERFYLKYKAEIDAMKA